MSQCFGTLATESAYKYGSAWLEELMDYLQGSILSHLEVAIKARVTREELTVASNIAILLCGGPGYAYATFALEFYDNLVKEQ